MSDPTETEQRPDTAVDYPHEVRAAVLREAGAPMSVETIRLRAVGPTDVRVRIEREADMPRFVDWVRTGQLDLRGLITGHGGLGDVNHALDELAARHGVRTLLSPGQA